MKLLFSIIGTTLCDGAGDGVKNFNLPDLRGRLAVGAGNGDPRPQCWRGDGNPDRKSTAAA